MPTPFPGMDPYLEHVQFWPDVHHGLISAIRDDLAAQLRPRYVARMEIDTYAWLPDQRELLGRPDVTLLAGNQDHGGVAEAVAAYGDPPMVTVHLPVRDTMRLGSIQLCTVSDQRVVAALEILSPANKRPGPGRRAYLRKRWAILDSPTHLVEIDLLRAWPSMPLGGAGRDVDYRILVSDAARRPRAGLLGFGVEQAIPSFRVPVLPGDEWPVLEVGALLHALYDRAGYDLQIDYRREPVPPLRPAVAVWADGLLRAAGLR
jgi:hypothetical protein